MYHENDPKILEARRALAAAGILALYGGRKGHGFWLYRTTPEIATRAINDVKFFLSIPVGSAPIVHNDGKRSGNSCFWRFGDALKLAQGGTK